MNELARRLYPRRATIALAITATVLLALVAAVLVWANTPLRGERGPALAAWQNPAIEITNDEGRFVLAPADGATSTGAGLVFYPGAKVEPSAYLYPLSGLAEAGVTVVIAKVPLGIAFLDSRSVDDVTEGVANVDRWAVGGHSLGGVQACQRSFDADALVLFGSYCASVSVGEPTLSIAAEHDGLTTADDIERSAYLLPPTETTFVTIEGANHASFGCYGPQPGDGVATIDAERMREELTSLIVPFLTA